MFLDWKKQYCENDYTTRIIYRLNVISIKLLMTFSTELEPNQNIFEICMETQRIPNNKLILRKYNRAERNRLPDFILYYKLIAIKTVWSWHRNRNIDQWYRIENPEINPYTYGH